MKPIFFIPLLILTLTAPARAGEDPMVDRLAADFFENELRGAQARQIERRTAQDYLEMDEEERAEFRAERAREWETMSAARRQSLRDAKQPKFENLSEDQKSRFRRNAASALHGGDGVDEDPGI